MPRDREAVEPDGRCPGLRIDHYLGLMIDRAVASENPVHVNGHGWDEATRPA